MKYVDIKSLVPGHILYRRENGEECEILDIIHDANDGIARRCNTGEGKQWHGSGYIRYRFYGFDCYPSALSKMFMRYGDMVAVKHGGMNIL